ncbi:MAG TPA: hypothetical protein VGV61_15650 [Thermoanaerobaculia bacterium]|jgi:hypothetical protein|nr:hypothetical protein [Thermoanaerobaculia bacterium]
MQLPPAIAGRRALLVVAHPGHELRVHGWLELARPQVWVLTDGSGHGEQGRLPSTARLLARAGATCGPLFGRFSDRDVYALMMRGDVAAAAELVKTLADTLVDQQVAYVAGDAYEGFNPVHDLCRLIIDAAVAAARRRSGRPIDDFEFALEGSPDWQGGGEPLGWDLDDAALARKLAAARNYPELAAEVERALRAHGADAFRRERMYRVEPLATVARRFDGQPAYERYGEERVAGGLYVEVLRHRDHFAPLAAALVALCQTI